MPSKSVHTMRIKDLAIAYDALSRHGHDSASAQQRILMLIEEFITEMEAPEPVTHRTVTDSNTDEEISF